MSASSFDFKPVIGIPCYRHAKVLQNNLTKLLENNVPIVIFDDGNSLEDKAILDTLSKEELVTIINSEVNQGKGAAMKAMFSYAEVQGYSHLLQIDADGQQDISLIPEFLQKASQKPTELLIGVPSYDNVPKGRLIARYITHFWVAIELGIFRVVDSMCGLRVYPIKPVMELVRRDRIAPRMAFDTEILVRLYWMGVNFSEMSVPVHYPEDGVSNFAPFRDNLQISLMHTKLCTEKILHYFKVRRRQYV